MTKKPNKKSEGTGVIYSQYFYSFVQKLYENGINEEVIQDTLIESRNDFCNTIASVFDPEGTQPDALKNMKDTITEIEVVRVAEEYNAEDFKDYLTIEL